MSGRSSVRRGLSGYRESLASGPFRRLWVAALVSRAGDAINFVALPLLAFTTTGSAAAVAGLVLVEGVALVVGGVAAQLVVDRLQPRHLLVAVDLGRAAAAAALAAVPTYPLALMVAAILGVGTSWFSPTSAALVPRLVDGEMLPSANSLLWTAGVALQLVAAPLGGALFIASARIPFALNAVSFAISAAILAGLPRQPAATVAVSSWRHVRASLRDVCAIPGLVALVVMQALAALAVGATSALLVVLAARGYGLNGAGYGVWLAVVGAGALLGPLIVPAISRRPPSRSVPTAYLIRGAGDVGLGLLSNSVAGGALLFAYGLNTSSGTVAFQTLIQEAAPPTVRGRTFALLDVTWQTGRLLSVAVGGGVALVFGIRAVFVGGGILLMAAAALGLMTLRASVVSEPAGGERWEGRT